MYKGVAYTFTVRKGLCTLLSSLFDCFFDFDLCKQEGLLYEGLHLLPLTQYIFTLVATVQGGVKCPVN